MGAELKARARSRSLILFDGVCGFCSAATRFVLSRDARDRFVFASLQGPVAQDILRRHQRDPSLLDTLYLVRDPGGPHERLLVRGRAVLGVLEELGLPWSLAAVFELLPSALLDLGYDAFAARRYRWFKRPESCASPRPEQREKFLD